MDVKQTQQFYTNNWREFVHLQYLTEIMKLIPEVITPNDKQERVDRYEITVDEHGEHPIKIVGVDKDGNKTELHYKPEITDRVNDLIRDNIKVLVGDDEQSWDKLKFIKSPDHDYFEVNAKLTDGNTVNTIIPKMTADDLKSVNRIKAYTNKIEIDYLEEDATGNLVEKTKVYDLDNYVDWDSFQEEINLTNNRITAVAERVTDLENTQHLNDRACKYMCINHGLVGHNILYNLGDTTHQLVSFDVDFQGCLNVSLQAGHEWEVECIPTDLTTGTEYNVEKTPVACQIVMEYEDGTIKYLDATCGLTTFKFTVPDDAVRGNIKHARFNGLLYFD